MPKQELLAGDDASEFIAICKWCGVTIGIGWKMKLVSPSVAAQEAAKALRDHDAICPGRP